MPLDRKGKDIEQQAHTCRQCSVGDDEVLVFNMWSQHPA